MSVTTQETIDALQRELAVVAERQVELKLHHTETGDGVIKALEAEYQRLSHQLERLQEAQRNGMF